MTKEEILNEHHPYYFNYGDDGPYWDKEHAESAMDEYAKQQSIAFAEWKEKKGYAMLFNTNIWQIVDDGPYSKRYSTTELYNLFLESTNNHKNK